MFLLCSIYARDGFGMEGSELLTYQTCQNHVQRLRMFVEVANISGSRGYAPGVLRHLLSSCCSNPRRTRISPDLGLATFAVRLCECMPWAVAGMKSAGSNNSSEISAKIAAFQSWTLGRTQYLLHTTACWLGVRTETSPRLYPRFFLILRCIAFAMPRRTGPP